MYTHDYTKELDSCDLLKVPIHRDQHSGGSDSCVRRQIAEIVMALCLNTHLSVAFDCSMG